MTIHDTRVWRIKAADDGSLARNVVSAEDGSDLLVAFDFSEVLNAGQTLSGTPTVADGAATVTFTGAALDEERKRVEARTDLTGIAAANYTISCTTATTDSDTLIGKGTLRVV